MENVKKYEESELFSRMLEVLKNIDKEYSGSWQTRYVQDDEFPDAEICEACTGFGSTEFMGENVDCFQGEDGCTMRHQDLELLGVGVSSMIEEIESILAAHFYPETESPIFEAETSDDLPF